MAQDAKPTQAPLLCATGCGFYGNPRTNGMCSVCYRDSLQRHTVAVRVGEPVPASLGSVEASPSTQPPPAMAGPALDENSQDPAEEADTQVEPAPGTFQAEPKTEDIAGVFRSPSVPNINGCTVPGSSELVEDTSRRGKRKCEEPLQLDADSGEGSGGTETEISVEPSTAELEKSKPKKSRCFTCRKKVGLTGFDCRCGNVFCGVHRYSDVHNCTFDYKADAAQKIRKENPVIVGEKITKI